MISKKIRTIIRLLRGWHKNSYGYWCSNDNFLIHRLIAYEKIYKKEGRCKYPLPYNEYLVVIKDNDKDNLNKRNLLILTKTEIGYLKNPIFDIPNIQRFN